MALAVIGSRTFQDYSYLKKTLQEYEGIQLIVSGGARGADFLAEKYAREFNVPIRIYVPDWQKYGKAAGPIRNRLIIDAADHVVAFWDGVSKGTKSSIDMAKEKGIPCDIYLI